MNFSRLKTLWCLASAAFFTGTVGAAESGGTKSAAEIAGRLSAMRQDGTSYVRMRMETGSGETLQIQVKARRTRGSSEVVYQVLWPKERKGEAVLLRKSGGAASGFHYTPPGKVRAIDASQMKEPLFGSDLAYEDAVDNFFAWGSQKLVGTDTIDRVECQVLESKPVGTRSIYGSVRTWVDTKRMVPLRVEKYSPSGQLVRRIDTTNIAHDDERRPIPANLSVRSRSVTQIDGSKIRHDVRYTDREFTPEGLAELAAPKGSPE